MTIEFLGIEVKDWLTCAAIIIGPIIAVQLQKFIERISATKERRLRLFKTLMATRGERVSRDHVQALNMIYIEFEGEQNVTGKWKEYNAHLNDKSYATFDAWFKKGDEFFTELLFAMSELLGYKFDKVQLKNDTYRPEAHVNLENSQLAVLEGLAKILNNEKSLQMEITKIPPIINVAENIER